MYFYKVNYILLLPRLIWKIWFASLMLVTILIMYPFFYLYIVVLKNHKLAYLAGYQVWAKSVCFLIGVFPKIIGKDKLPSNENYVMVSNHTSQLDIVVPFTLIKKSFAFLSKEELAKVLGVLSEKGSYTMIFERTSKYSNSSYKAKFTIK